MYKRLSSIILSVILGIVVSFILQGLAEAHDLQMKLEPNVVIIGASYNGADVKVTGEIPANAEAVVYVMGQRKDTEFKKKGKALGLLWMNLGTVVFHNVPNLYLVYTGPGMDTKAIPVGFEAIKNETEVTPVSEDKNFLFKEFIKLKRKEGLYSINSNALQYNKVSGGMKAFSCTVRLPSKLVPGTYEVNVVAINSGKIVAQSKQALKAVEKGLPNLVASLAFRHSTTYGILATVIAIIAGLIMGVIFKGGKGGH